jgi:hypothetical protein
MAKSRKPQQQQKPDKSLSFWPRHLDGERRSSSGNLAMFAAIRRGRYRITQSVSTRPA